MPSSIIAKYSPELIFGENVPVAITDSKLRIVWFNKSFKDNFAGVRLKGKELSSLLSSYGIDKEIDSSFTKPAYRQIPQINKVLHIVPLFGKNRKDKPENYKIELTELSAEIKKKITVPDSKTSDIDFRSTLQDILTLLVKENSIDILSAEILSKSISLTKSDLGI
jgi:hypothetical protein